MANCECHNHPAIGWLGYTHGLETSKYLPHQVAAPPAPLPAAVMSVATYGFGDAPWIGHLHRIIIFSCSSQNGKKCHFEIMRSTIAAVILVGHTVSGLSKDQCVRLFGWYKNGSLPVRPILALKEMNMGPSKAANISPSWNPKQREINDVFPKQQPWLFQLGWGFRSRWWTIFWSLHSWLPDLEPRIINLPPPCISAIIWRFPIHGGTPKSSSRHGFTILFHDSMTYPPPKKT